MEVLAQLEKSYTELRKNNLIGQILRYQTHRSTEYFSRWIEAKNLNSKNTK